MVRSAPSSSTGSFFFFQAEDGIRDVAVTGVQTCALPISPKVRVNAIQAGPFFTDISKAWDLDAFRRRARATLALQRGGEPAEIVGAAVYLASQASSFTTGAVIRVDGGAA